MWILKKWALKYHGEKACQKKQSRELNLLLLWLYWSLLHLYKYLLFSYKKLERKRCGCMFNMMLFSNLLFQPKVVKTLNSENFKHIKNPWDYRKPMVILNWKVWVTMQAKFIRGKFFNFEVFVCTDQNRSNNLWKKCWLCKDYKTFCTFKLKIFNNIIC